MSYKFTPWLLVAVACLATAMQPADGCDTPVYRYAMYRWQPAPYEVYFFHEGELTEEQQAVADFLGSAAEQEQEPANVVYLPVDTAGDEDLASANIPADVRDLWQKTTVKTTPGYLIVSPRGGKLFVGSLTLAEARSLVDSPVRRKIAAALAEGNAAVYLLLTHPAATPVEGNPGLWAMLENPDLLRRSQGRTNQESRDLLNKLQAEVAAGKVNLFAGRSDLFPEVAEEKAPGDDPPAVDAKPAPAPQIAWLEVDRDDPAEQWLVRQLLAVEDDLQGIQQPSVYVLYGRGRTLPPFIGKGVHHELLKECLEFVTGACSCTIKDQNPGVDLLMTADWEAAAAKVAEKFGNEEGNESLFSGSEFFPELIVPAQPLAAAETAGDAGADALAAADPPAPQAGVDTPASPGDPAASNETPAAAETPANRTGDAARSASVPPTTDTPVAGDTVDNGADTRAKNADVDSPRKLALATSDKPLASTSAAAADDKAVGGMFFTIALGLGVGVLVLLGATLFAFRGH
ncbi:hypothetical protein [Lignipirellula cremea]|uniref:Preprotein translocase subunit SecD n=1 Tax=Lignipirellula cremea TaxID=2528010 RepID=A0A518E1N1_9BACT|nr:hypothetical protein [Lignipirellula cremea]QDU97999.1 hypothetical protein Pla8534_58600 [Lignipirellula cremea]